METDQTVDLVAHSDPAQFDSEIPHHLDPWRPVMRKLLALPKIVAYFAAGKIVEYPVECALGVAAVVVLICLKYC